MQGRARAPSSPPLQAPTPTPTATPDMHLQMSKKIASLSRLIFQLNTRNEDHKSAMELLQYQHQLELQQVARDAATKIARFKTLVESRKAAGQMEGQMHEMRRQYDAERQHADRLFTDLKGRMAAKERRLHLEFQVKVDTQQMEIAQMSARFQERLAALEGVNDELRRALEAAGTSSSQGIEEWRRRYDEDLKEVQETHRARLQAEKDALRKDHVESMHRALQVRRCVRLLVCSLNTCALTGYVSRPISLSFTGPGVVGEPARGGREGGGDGTCPAERGDSRRRGDRGEGPRGQDGGVGGGAQDGDGEDAVGAALATDRGGQPGR